MSVEWHLSALVGWALTGVWRPLCSVVWDLPDCAARRAYVRRMDPIFAETGHCQRIHVQWVEMVARG